MRVSAVLMRGGTSKCWVFDTRDLDAVGGDRDRLLLRLYGSPDPRQVDGVGGATSTTSKAVLLAPSATPDADVDYTFAQVGIAEERVDWSNNCGNCSAVVGLYALQQGWVRPAGETTRVVVRNTNTGKTILQDVPTPGGAPTNEGDLVIEGVPFPSPGVDLGFTRPAGAVTGALLPTGRPLDRLDTSEGQVRASLVDAANPTALLWGPDLGLAGDETPAQVDGDPRLLEVLGEARAHASVLMGIAPSAADADRVSRAIPKLAWTAPSAAGDQGIQGRMLSMGRTHPALAVTVSVAFAAASVTGGTVVPSPADGGPLRIATPSGTVTVRAELDHAGGLETAYVTRNARRLATAELELPGAGPRLCSPRAHSAPR
ncbi:methylitaconate delta2-delta3-isomerase [Nocardiopsis sp. HNM0947]|uniref:Methylitaconate delta2-delta3-isomerase n=1 Tax=Nocardiopsis coralli TaxID=2772213 RepID=A0ABR9PBF4_9ACTN|nr:methylitaconate delta2-delta3-isomerase [Nocardiopsis coralli]